MYGDAQELADARADYAAVYFVQTITRQRKPGRNTVPDQDYPGRVVDAKRERFHKEGEQMRAVARLQIELQWDADVLPGDTLVVEGGGKFTAIGSDKERPERLRLAVDVTGA